MKRLLSIVWILILLFQLSACGNDYISDAFVCSCSEEVVHRFDWEDDRYRIFTTYPNVALATRLSEQALHFDSVSAFADTVRKKAVTESELATLQKGAEEAGHVTHSGKIAFPALDKIRTLCYNGRALPLTVTWFGCSDYALTGKVVIDGKPVPLSLRYFGFENFNTKKAEDNGAYERRVTFYEFFEGDISYRVCERELYRESELVTCLYDVEIKEDGACYYLMLGFPEEGYGCPKLNWDAFKAFTLGKVK